MDNKMISPEGRRWSVSFVASVTCHVLLAMLITWQYINKPLPKHPLPQSMDVVLLNPEKPHQSKPPKNAKAISNLNAEGGSNKSRDKFTRAAQAPLVGSVPQRPKPAAPMVPRTPPPPSTPRLQQQTRTLAMRTPSPAPPEPPKRKVPHKQQKRPKQPPRIPLSNLMPSSMALAQLSRDYDRERRMKEMLSRSADIPINTRDEKYAPYAHLLVRALEDQWRPGQANYREYSERERTALLKLTIEKDGSLGGVEIVRPSPIGPLNDSAIAAIHAAAPFRPLPSVWALDQVTFFLTFEVINDRFVFRPVK